MQQVHEARRYITRAEALGHPPLLQSLDGLLEFLLYFRGALIAYAKCFVSAGIGKMTLDGSEVFRGKQSYLEHHLRLIDLRHKYAAHSDDNEIENPSIVVDDMGSEYVVRLQYQSSFPFDRLYELRDLIGHLESYVVDRQAKHIESIKAKVGKPVRIEEGERPIAADDSDRPRSG